MFTGARAPARERARTRIAQTWRNVEGSAAEVARGARPVNFHEHHCDEARHGTPFRRPRRSSRDGDAFVPLRCPCDARYYLDPPRQGDHSRGL
jgi:hypothetical protein